MEENICPHCNRPLIIDRFEKSDTINKTFLYPCNICIHNVCFDDEEPCCYCTHNQSVGVKK